MKTPSTVDYSQCARQIGDLIYDTRPTDLWVPNVGSFERSSEHERSQPSTCRRGGGVCGIVVPLCSHRQLLWHMCVTALTYPRTRVGSSVHKTVSSHVHHLPLAFREETYVRPMLVAPPLLPQCVIRSRPHATHGPTVTSFHTVWFSNLVHVDTWNTCTSRS